jgi:hypothetical protein
MRFTLRSTVLAPLVLAAAALGANTAMAQPIIDVPFDFTVAGQACPAGTYSVRKDVKGDTVNLIGKSRNFVWAIGPGDPNPSDKRVILTFDKLGSGPALRSVQFGSSITSRLDKKVKAAEDATLQVQGQ